MRLMPSITIDDSICWRLRAICMRAAITRRDSCSGSDRSVTGSASCSSWLTRVNAASGSSSLFTPSRGPLSSSLVSMVRSAPKRCVIQSRALFMLMLSAANWSTVCATALSSSAYASICWIEASTIAWNTFWISPPTNFGKSTAPTKFLKFSAPCFTEPASKSLPAKVPIFSEALFLA